MTSQDTAAVMTSVTPSYGASYIGGAGSCKFPTHQITGDQSLQFA